MSKNTGTAREAFMRLALHLIEHHTDLVVSTPIGQMLRTLSTALLNEKRDKLALVDEIGTNFERQVKRADIAHRDLVECKVN